jgi:hypothetical protein
MLVETGMSSVTCLMQRIRPSLFTKKDGGEVWSTGFKWPRGVRGKEEEILYLLGGRAHNAKLQELLVEACRAWVPYLGESKTGIMYTRLQPRSTWRLPRNTPSRPISPTGSHTSTRTAGSSRWSANFFMDGIFYAAQEVHTRISNMILSFIVFPENGLRL